MNTVEDAPATDQTMPLSLKLLTGSAAIGLGIGLYFALGYAGTDSTQGQVQRLFYIHLPSFTGAAIAFVVTFTGSLVYLFSRQPRWEMLAVAAAEVGLAQTWHLAQSGHAQSGIPGGLVTRA